MSASSLLGRRCRRTSLALLALTFVASLLFTAPRTASATSSADFCQNLRNLPCCETKSANLMVVASWDRNWARCQLPLDAVDVSLATRHSSSSCDGKWRYRADLKTIAITGGCRASFVFGRSEDGQGPYPYGRAAEGPNTRIYDTIRTVYLHDLDTCARVRFTGQINFDLVFALRPYQNVTIDNAKTEVWFYELESGRCTPRAKNVGGVELVQSWSGYSCEFNPSIGFGVWEVSVEFWPGCGQKNVAKRTSTFSRTGSYYVQSNSGFPVEFGTISMFSDDFPPCFGGYVDLEVKPPQAGNESDQGTTGLIEVCL